MSVIPGGAIIDCEDYAMVGSSLVVSPSPGISADADEGFAVGAGSIARDMRGQREPSVRDGLVVNIDAYLWAPGAFRRGQTISRRSIIEFANYAGDAALLACVDPMVLDGCRHAAQGWECYSKRPNLAAQIESGLQPAFGWRWLIESSELTARTSLQRPKYTAVLVITR